MSGHTSYQIIRALAQGPLVAESMTVRIIAVKRQVIAPRNPHGIAGSE
jgi:hypothetical protein